MLRVSIVNAFLMTAVLAAIDMSAASAATVDNVVGIVADGSPVTNGGLDKDGYAYSATLLGTSVSWFNSTFTLGAAGTYDAVSSTTIALPAVNGSALNLLATAVNGNQPNQTFVVNYTDGTSSSFTQSVSDWYTPTNYPGESQAVKMAYRIGPTGATNSEPVYLYGYSFALNSAKTIKSITLPNNRNVVVLAVDISPAATASSSTTTAPSSSTDNVVGIVRMVPQSTRGPRQRRACLFRDLSRDLV